MIRLIVPKIEYADEIMAFRNELLFLDENFAGCNGLRKSQTCEEWLEYLRKMSSEKTCPSGLVPSDTLIYVREDDNCVVGMIDIRRHINSPVLSTYGGHIGYTIRPSERRKGYAKRMLRDALLFCRENGHTNILITCNSNNYASERTILANGGVLENEIIIDGNCIKRYWVSL